jgi:hypothetical protein
MFTSAMGVLAQSDVSLDGFNNKMKESQSSLYEMLNTGLWYVVIFAFVLAFINTFTNTKDPKMVWIGFIFLLIIKAVFSLFA